MLYVRIMILFITILGYSYFIKDQFNVRIEFGPSLTCTGISSAMFIAGILNVFLPATYIITAVGISLFFFAIIKKKFRFGDSKHEFIIMFIWSLVLLYFAVLIRGSHFTHYDNFSHWVTVIKCMLINDRMPNFQDPLIMFQAYPLGSSLFIYYVCKIIGQTDACYSFGQIIMLISFIFPMAAFVKKKNIFAGLTIPAFALMALICDISIYDLLVDTLMPLAGVSLFSIIEYEFCQENTKNIDRVIWEMVPMSIFLLQVKNSGIFFCLIAWTYFLIQYRRQNFSKKQKIQGFIKFTGLGVALPLITTYLWKRHVALVYNAGDTSKHAMTIKNYENIRGEKTAEDIKDIGRQIGERLSDIHDASFIIMAIITIAMLIIIIYFFILKKKHIAIGTIRELVSIYIIFFLYVISVFGMYIFSMPLGEASTLASYGRYMLTVDIFCLGITVTFLLQKDFYRDRILITLGLICCVILTIIPFKNGIKTLFSKQDYTATTRSNLQQLIQKNGVSSGANYLIYSNDDDGGYMYFLSRYELWSPNVTIATSENFGDCLSNIELYNYVIVVTPDKDSKKSLKTANLSEYANDDQSVIDVSSISQ